MEGPRNPTVPKPDVRNLQAGDARMQDFCVSMANWPVAYTGGKPAWLATFAPGVSLKDVAGSARNPRRPPGKCRLRKVESFDDLKALTGAIAARRALDPGAADAGREDGRRA